MAFLWTSAGAASSSWIRDVSIGHTLLGGLQHYQKGTHIFFLQPQSYPFVYPKDFGLQYSAESFMPYRFLGENQWLHNFFSASSLLSDHLSGEYNLHICVYLPIVFFLSVISLHYYSIPFDVILWIVLLQCQNSWRERAVIPSCGPLKAPLRGNRSPKEKIFGTPRCLILMQIVAVILILCFPWNSMYTYCQLQKCDSLLHFSFSCEENRVVW